MQEDLLRVVLVVAVGVLEEDQVRLLRDEHAAVPELEAGGVVEVAGEHRALVGLAVAVGVFEDEQLVVHRRLRLPVRVVLPGRDPQPALGVERHLHRVDELGELLLRREQLDLQPLADRHLPGWSRRRHETWRHGPLPGSLVFASTNGSVFESSDRRGPTPPAIAQMRLSRLAIITSRIGELALQHVVVGRQDVFLGDAWPSASALTLRGIAAHERQERAVAVGRVAVGDAIAQEPVLVLVDDRLPQLGQQTPPDVSASRRRARGR